GSPEMNMTVLHGLARLYRETGEPRYLAMARAIEKDWERAGDYLRTGLAGQEFWETPRPRWESLHDLQGLVELYRITGDPAYRTPMHGIREASAHSIVFQARAGTPELNCCSVNGPRGLGMLSEWAVLHGPNGLVLNYYGPATIAGSLRGGAAFRLREETDYPL